MRKPLYIYTEKIAAKTGKQLVADRIYRKSWEREDKSVILSFVGKEEEEIHNLGREREGLISSQERELGKQDNVFPAGKYRSEICKKDLLIVYNGHENVSLHCLPLL